eukprot:TRINITY_DN4716_c0_g1_i12.p1 TRINITY_DN4716_c0_g1~~TRINITY_DN4716_c0_g1_i12.p1  ORF type:complete len:551 (+),score=78.64 TRINITY_DN4716_c0_g1_i12:87-1739(+)
MAKRTKLSSSWISRFEKIEIDVPVNRDFFNASGEEISVWLSRLASGQIPLTGNPSFPVFPDVPTVALLQEAIAAAAAGGQLYWLQHLLQHEEMTAVGRQKALLAASRHGQLGAVELLLQHGGVDASAQRNAALRSAARGGHELVVSCLLEAGGVDASACGNAALIEAAANGHVATVHRLLKEDSVDVTARNQLAFRKAVAGGHVPMVEYLMRLPKVRPPADYYDAVMHAARNKNMEMLRVLFRHPLLIRNLAAQNRALNTAIQLKDHEYVDQLLEAFHIRPTLVCLKSTVTTNQMELFQLLLPRVPTNLKDRQLLLSFLCATNAIDYLKFYLQTATGYFDVDGPCCAAARHGHIDVLKIFYGSDHSFHTRSVLETAARHGQLGVVDYLLECCSDNLSGSLVFSLIYSILHNHEPVTARLLQFPALDVSEYLREIIFGYSFYNENHDELPRVVDRLLLEPTVFVDELLLEYEPEAQQNLYRTAPIAAHPRLLRQRVRDWAHMGNFVASLPIPSFLARMLIENLCVEPVDADWERAVEMRRLLKQLAACRPN